MINPHLAIALAVVMAFVANGFYWNHHGASAKDTEWKAKTYAELYQSSEAARKQQTMWQTVVNGAVANEQAEHAGISSRLAAALGELRKRPERRIYVPGIPITTCEGATGAELSGRDAEFLERLAARANDIRAGLRACYEVMDAMEAARAMRDRVPTSQQGENNGR